MGIFKKELTTEEEQVLKQFRENKKEKPEVKEIEPEEEEEFEEEVEFEETEKEEKLENNIYEKLDNLFSDYEIENVLGFLERYKYYLNKSNEE